MYNPMMGLTPQFSQAMIPAMTHAAVQPNLPYPANSFITPPQQPNIANGIFQTPLSEDPGIAPYSQMISWALANEIVGRASTNALRIFGYNLYSQNSFNNNEFLELARLVTERVRLAIIRNEFQSIEQAIQVLVPDTYTLASGANIRRFDGLTAFVTNQVANECLGAVQAIDRIYNDITGMSRVSSQAQMAGNMVAPMQNNNNGFTNFNATPHAPAPNVNVAVAMISNKNQGELTAMERQLMQLAQQQAAQVTHQTIQPQQQQQRSPLSGAYRANPTMSNPVQPAVLHVGKNAPEYTIEQNEFERQVNQAQNAPAMNEVSVVNGVTSNSSYFTRSDIINTPEDINDLKVRVEETNNGKKFYFNINNERHEIESTLDYGAQEWKPTALQPFHPLVCLNHQRITYVKLDNQSVLAVVQQLPDGEYHMDYDKHAVNANYVNKPPIVPQTQKAVEKPSFSDLKPAGMIIARTNSIYSLSVEQALSECFMTAYLDLNGEVRKDAFVFECQVLTPIITRSPNDAKKLYDELVNLSCMRNFAAAAEHINSITNVSLRDKLNVFMTERVNTVVRFELSMAGDPITDFIDDHVDLLNVIKTHYAGAIAETINSYQNRIIRSACYAIKSSDVKDAYEYFADSEDSAETVLEKTIFIARDITIAVVNFYSEDLAAFFAKESCAVLENAHPQLREIIEQSLDVASIDKLNISKSYLKTLDGYVFDVAKSITQSSAYLIRKA